MKNLLFLSLLRIIRFGAGTVKRQVIDANGYHSIWHRQLYADRFEGQVTPQVKNSARKN
jgi:hypothetical protein